MAKKTNSLTPVSPTSPFDLNDVERACHSSLLLIVPVTGCIVSVFVLYLAVFYAEAGKSPPRPENQQVVEKSYEHIRWYELLSVVGYFTFFIAFATFTLYLLLKHRCYKIIYYWLCTSTFVLLVFIFTLIFRQILIKANLTVDFVSTACLTLNNGYLGMASVFNAQQMPKILNQLYLIAISGMVAIQMLSNLSGFVCWAVLFAVSFWDLFAVLTKRGPLNMILKIVKERDIPLMPGMIYSAWMIMGQSDTGNRMQDERRESRASTTASRTSSKENVSKEISVKELASREISINQSTSQESRSRDSAVDRRRSRLTASRNLTEEEIVRLDDVDLAAKDAQQRLAETTQLTGAPEEASDRAKSPNEAGQSQSSNVKLGLGDFVFYSVLVGKSSQSMNYFIILCTTLTMSIGLILTLILLIVFRKPMPALPISLFLGIFVYSISFNFMTHFQDELNFRAIIL